MVKWWTEDLSDGFKMTVQTYIDFFEGTQEAIVQEEAKQLQKEDDFYVQHCSINSLKEN